MPRTDLTGAAPGLVWPANLRRPVPPPALVYLDRNHWVNLAKSARGDKDAVAVAYRSLLSAAHDAVDRNAAVFVLTETHYVEQAQNPNERQRREVMEIMEELTGFTSLLPRQLVMRLELQAAIDEVCPGTTMPRESLDLVGYGVTHVAGSQASLVVGDAKGRFTPENLKSMLGDTLYAELIAAADLQAQRDLLSGPSDDQIAALRDEGFSPELSRQGTRRRAEQEQQQSTNISRDVSEPWRVNGRVRDVVSAFEFKIEMLHPLAELTRESGLTLQDLTGGTVEGIRKFSRCMPGFEVAVEIKTKYHMNLDHKWAPNDILDIDALALAVPYCDIVFTDKGVRKAIIARGLDIRMQTIIPRQPSELADLLRGLPPGSPPSTAEESL